MFFLNEIIDISNVTVVESSNHKEVIETLLSLVKNSPKIANFDEFREAIWEREKIISTGIGLGLAIPHARRGIIKDFVGAVVLIKKGVEWKSIDDKDVNLAFMVGSPLDTYKEYFQLLAQTVLLWKDEHKRRKILSSKTKEELFSILKELKI